MSFGIYVREFKESKCYKSNINIHPPSKYFPFPMRDVLFRSKKINIDDYILCPLYEKKRGGDFQIGMTGTVENKENFEKTLERELGEEIGLIPKNNFDLTRRKYKWKKLNNEIIDFVTYEISINKCKYLTNEDILNKMKIDLDKEDTPKNSLKNDKNKIGCFIFGDLSDISKFLNQPMIQRYYSEDEIIGIVAIQLKIIKEIYKK